MNQRSNPRLLAILLTSALLFAGLLYTQSPPDQKRGEDAIRQVYQAILDRYVAEIDPDKLSDAAIDGMLTELDPYSQHINDNNSYRLDAITTGEYGGVGIQLGRMNDSLIVISPMDGTPAYRQGIQAGDRIVKIDSVWTRKLSIDEAADLVRGPKGSQLTLMIRRIGEPDLLTFEIQRELIKVPDVSYSGLMDHRMGYIKLSNFSKFSAEELEKAIRKLDRTGLNGLIIDLRGNPGGLLSAALQSADLLIPKDALLLETKGRIDQSNKKYYARRNPIVDDGLPVAVLIDEGSASASEILAGVLQDYDRAVLLGEPSYGKGLVQTVTTLNPDSRLKLTTAKYYLPSGRLIQKRDIATEVIYEDLLTGEAGAYYSEGKRSFEAGAGVSPDVTVSALQLSDMEREMWRNRLFFKYALELNDTHPGLTLPIHLQDADVDSFYTWLTKNELFPTTAMAKWIARSEPAIDSTSAIYDQWLLIKDQLLALERQNASEIFEKNRLQFISGLETELANVIGGNGARIAASVQHDPIVLRAIELLRSRPEFDAILAGSGIGPTTD